MHVLIKLLKKYLIYITKHAKVVNYVAESSLAQADVILVKYLPLMIPPSPFPTKVFLT